MLSFLLPASGEKVPKADEGRFSRGHRHLAGVQFARCAILLTATALLLACGAQTGGYANLQSAQALTEEPAPDPSADRGMYLDLITKMQQRGLYFASLAHIDSYAQRYGEPPELQILRADAERETGKTASAARIYESLRDSDQAAAAYHGLGLIAAGEHRYADAARNLAEAVSRAPIDAALLSDLGYARLRAGDIAGAREPLAKAAELEPGNPKLVANLALLLMISGHPERAEAMMREARLPVATRDAVVRAAADVANAREHGRSVRTPPRRSASNSDGLRRSTTISETMLDRFGSPPNPSGEPAHEHH